MIKLIEGVLNWIHRDEFRRNEEDYQREQNLLKQRKAFKRDQDRITNANLLSALKNTKVDDEKLSSTQKNRESIMIQHLTDKT